jgi:hypothetical protein
VERATLKGHTKEVTSVAFSPDGTRIVSGSWDNTLKLWDAATGVERATLKGHTDLVRDVAFSPDGTRIVSTSNDTTVKLWDAATGAERATLKGHTNLVTRVAFSPDGTRIVLGSGVTTLKLWDAATGAERATLKGHTNLVTCVAFSPDGTRIVSGSFDNTVKVWDGANGQELNIPPEMAWLKSENRKHPNKNWWLHREGDNAVVMDLTVSEREIAFRKGRAIFRPFEAEEAFRNAKEPYARAFWKGQMALNVPNVAQHWEDFKNHCNDEPTWRLMKQTCDLVLQQGPHERASQARAWAIERPQRAEKVIADLEFVFHQPAEEISNWLIFRTKALLQRQKPAQAVTTAERFSQWAETIKDNRNRNLNRNSQRYNAACMYALCAAGIVNDRDKLVGESVALLQKAMADGYFSNARIAHIEQDSDFDGIRQHPKFVAFLKELSSWRF